MEMKFNFERYVDFLLNTSIRRFLAIFYAYIDILTYDRKKSFSFFYNSTKRRSQQSSGHHKRL